MVAVMHQALPLPYAVTFLGSISDVGSVSVEIVAEEPCTRN
jgi:hypothetical protein